MLRVNRGRIEQQLNEVAALSIDGSNGAQYPRMVSRYGGVDVGFTRCRRYDAALLSQFLKLGDSGCLERKCNRTPFVGRHLRCQYPVNM